MSKWLNALSRYMRILLSNEINRVDWCGLVQTSANGTWFQTPASFEFFASQPELFKSFAFGLENNGKLRGVCCGYITKEKFALKQLLTKRAIIVAGPVLADDCTNDETEALMHAVRKSLKSKAIYIECRNFNSYEQWKDAFASAGFEYLPHLNFHVDTSSVEIVDANLGKGRKRDIKTSFRDGAVIIEQPTIEQVREYYVILENLYRTKVKTPLFPLSFFEALYHHPDGRFLLVGLPNAEGKTEIIGGTVCVAWNRTNINLTHHTSNMATPSGVVYEWFVSGRDGEWKSIFPSSVATYAGIKYAAEHNCPRFDMMGAGTPDEAYGVRDFKAKFGGVKVEHGRFIVINNPLLYRIGKLGVLLMKRYGGKSIAKSVATLPIRKDVWSEFVQNHPFGTIFHTPQMFELYRTTAKQEPMVVNIEKNGQIEGLILAVIQWNGIKLTKPLTARSIIIGGPLAKDNDPMIIRELMDRYERLLPKYVVYSEIRPVYDIREIMDERVVNDLTKWKRVGHYNLVLRTDKSEEVLWDGMHKERRRNVGHAENVGLRFEEIKSDEGRRQVISLLQRTYRRKHVPMADKSLFENLMNSMPKYVHFFAAYQNEEMIAGQIRLGYKDLLYAWYAGSDERYFKLRPNDFLMWNVIKWAHEQGYTWFDFGGGGEPGVEYGVRDYKLKYGCAMYDYGRYRYVHHPWLYKLGVTAINLVKKKE